MIILTLNMQPGTVKMTFYGGTQRFFNKREYFIESKNFIVGMYLFSDYLNQRRFTKLLCVFLICVALVWFLHFLWRRRKLYWASFNIPGPFSLPLIGSAFYLLGRTYDSFEYLCYLYCLYPGIYKFWFGTKLIYAVSDPKYFEILLTSPHALKKENLYRFAQPVTGQGLFTAVSVPSWRYHRKIIRPTFNQRILDEFMEVFAEQSEILVKELRKYAGKADIDILKLVSRCTLDIICETAMGVQIKAQSTDASFLKLVDSAMEIVMTRIFNIYYHCDIIFSYSPLGRKFQCVTRGIRSFTKKVITEKKELRETEKPEGSGLVMKEEILKRTVFLDLLLDINDQGKFQFTDEELLDETITFMIAGSDTTSTTLCFTLLTLALHQEIQDKVLAEILEVIGPEGQVELRHLSQLNYLERVIKESLRLFPLAPIILRTAEEDIDVGDFIVYKGCSISFGILWSHRNEKYWPDPLKFDPDRFLPEEVAKRNPAAFIPFSYGPRNCLGMKFAIMTMKTVLSTALRKYHIRTEYKKVEDVKLKANLVLRPEKGFKMSLELRN